MLIGSITTIIEPLQTLQEAFESLIVIFLLTSCPNKQTGALRFFHCARQHVDVRFPFVVNVFAILAGRVLKASIASGSWSSRRPR